MWKLCPQCNSRYQATSGHCPLDGAELVDTPDPMLGRVVGGRYRLVELLGAGGMGSVYKARHVLLQRDVAIKLLSPRLIDDPVQKKRFLGEAEATNLLRHENIVDIADCGVDGRHPYLVMELLDGEPLDARIERGAVPPWEATGIVIDVARALARAHQLRVVHRDIKPGNVFLCAREPRVKVLDFGIAHMHRDASLTDTGQVFGTPEYMSPEQAKGERATPASDLYSLGVTLFEMLTRRMPFEGSVTELMLRHVRDAPPRLRDLDPSLPAELDDIVARLLAKSPAARHRDAHHLIEELERAQDALAQRSRPPPARGSARAAPLAATVDAVADVPPVVPTGFDAWRARRGVFRDAVEAAHGGAAPPGVLALLEEFDQELTRAPEVEAEVDALVRELGELEREGDARRERLAHALDTLTREESAVAREVEALREALTAAGDAEARARADLAALWRETAAALGAAPAMTTDDAARLRALGAQAAALEEARGQREELEDRARKREAAREDLAFQVSQFRGRVVAVSVEVDHDAGLLRERMAALGRRLADRHEALALLADALAQHLAAFPEARRMISQETAPTRPQAAVAP